LTPDGSGPGYVSGRGTVITTDLERAQRAADNGSGPSVAEALGFTPDGVLVVDDEGIVLDANQAAAELLSEPLEVLLGSSRVGLLAAERTHLVVTSPAGRARSLEAVVRDLSWNGGRLWVISLHDISHLQRMVRDLTVAIIDQRVKVAASTHELRSPLASIMWSAETLKDALTEGQLDVAFLGDVLDRIIHHARELSALLRAAQDAMLLDPITTVVPRPIDLAPFLRSSVARKHWSRQVVVECPVGLMVKGDPTSVWHMVSNCIVNAQRHGRPPVELRCQAVNSHVEIRVLDNGPGVPDSLIAGLFETPESTVEGGGAGLLIARYLARISGGDCWYEGRTPEGISFVISLPTSGHAEPEEV
jgi:signal transduction histidine kinase